MHFVLRVFKHDKCLRECSNGAVDKPRDFAHMHIWYACAANKTPANLFTKGWRGLVL